MDHSLLETFTESRNFWEKSQRLLPYWKNFQPFKSGAVLLGHVSLQNRQ